MPNENMSLSKRPSRLTVGSKVLQLRVPSLAAFVAVEWSLVMAGYALGWSERFLLPISVVAVVFTCVVAGTAVGFYFLGGGIRLSASAATQASRALLATPQAVNGLYRKVWGLWILASISEFGIAGRVPLLDAARGVPSNYLYFGVPSLHGLLLAAGCALALIDQATRISQGRRIIGPRTLIVLGWLFILLSRKHMVILLIQMFLLAVASGRVRLQVKQFVRGSVVLCGLIFGFGALGTARSAGAVGIKEKLLYSGPSFVPDGFVWIYAYATTPIANFANALDLGYRGERIWPLNTFGGLVPSFLTGEVPTYTFPPWALTSNFNVSTGYIGPLLDGGILYIFLYAVLIGTVAGLLRGRSASLGALLAYFACYQCTTAMLYANNFGNLNNVFQIVILLLLVPRGVERLEVADVPATSEFAQKPSTASTKVE